MCLIIPGKVVSIDGDTAIVDYDFEKREVNCSMISCSVGDYVIVQAKFIVEIIPQEKAQSMLALLTQ